jgi:Tfp pilus assembly protein PilN
VRAVNLIPTDARRGGRAVGGRPQGGPAYVVLGVLAAAVLLVTVYVLTSNTISDRQARIASLQTQATQERAEAARLVNYADFAKLAEARAATVREIAATRFDWHGALSDLSKVVPANTSLQSLFGSVAPGAQIAGASGAAAGSGISDALRQDVAVPAFELTGCTASQDDVARLMSRLRLINGVTRVTLGDSQKVGAAQGGASVTGSGSTAPVGCGPNAPTFDLVVFFAPLPGAGPTGIASASTQPVSNTTTTASTTTTTTAATTTTAPTTTAPTTTAPTTTAPATTTSGGSQ